MFGSYPIRDEEEEGVGIGEGVFGGLSSVFDFFVGIETKNELALRF